MKDFKKTNRFGGDRGGSRFGGGGFGRPSFNNRREDRSRGRDSSRAEMHQAVCSQCHKSCEVPFRPSGDKPVYCKECFTGKENNFSDRDDRRSPRRDFGNRDRFDNRSESRAPRADNNDVSKKVELLIVKVDRLIQSIENLNRTKNLESKKTDKEKPKDAETKKASISTSLKEDSTIKASVKKSKKAKK